MKATTMKALAVFDADMEEAMEYVSSDKMYSLRSGKHVVKHKRKGNAKNQLNAASKVYSRTRSRLGADGLEHGVLVPAYFRTKPKDTDYARDTIRKASIDEAGMEDEYRMYAYKAAGMI